MKAGVSAAPWDTEFRLRSHARWFGDRGNQSQYAARRGPQIFESEACRRKVDVGVKSSLWNPPKRRLLAVSGRYTPKTGQSPGAILSVWY